MPPENPQNYAELRATAREFCPTVRQEAETDQEERKNGQGVPEFVEDRPDQTEEMKVWDTGEREELRRSHRRGRPMKRFTYDTLGHPSYHKGVKM